MASMRRVTWEESALCTERDLSKSKAGFFIFLNSIKRLICTTFQGVKRMDTGLLGQGTELKACDSEIKKLGVHFPGYIWNEKLRTEDLVSLVLVFIKFSQWCEYSLWFCK
jgi:hypothetical protein